VEAEGGFTRARCNGRREVAKTRRRESFRSHKHDLGLISAKISMLPATPWGLTGGDRR